MTAQLDFPVVPAPNPGYTIHQFHLRGTQEEMGYQHAKLVKQVGGYEPTLEYYSALLPQLLSMTWTNPILAGIRDGLVDLGLRRLESTRPADFLARTYAFADELGFEKNHARHILFMDLFQNVVGLAGRVGYGPFERRLSKRPLLACSTLAVWGDKSADGRVLHARNFDLPGIGLWDRAPTVVFCDPEKDLRYGFVTTLGVDTPGITAFNEAGLTLTMHTRFHRDFRFTGAAVVDLGHDIIRRAETLSDAVRIAREKPVASTWGIAISSGREGRAISIETTGKTVAVLEPSNEDGYLTCTNRYRHPLTMAGEVQSSGTWANHSDGREQRLVTIVEQGSKRGGLQIADLEQALGDHEDPTHPGKQRAGGSILAQPITIQSIISDPENARIRVSAGPAPTSWGPYVDVAWDWTPEVGAEVIQVDEAPAGAHAVSARFQTGTDATGYAHFMEAHVIEMETANETDCLSALERAVHADPEEPTYRFLAGAFRLKTGDFQGALTHFRTGLEHEHAPYRRGLLLLWASRSADLCKQTGEARAYRQELLSIDHSQLEKPQKSARREAKRAYSARKLRHMEFNLALADVL